MCLMLHYEKEKNVLWNQKIYLVAMLAVLSTSKRERGIHVKQTEQVLLWKLCES